MCGCLAVKGDDVSPSDPTPVPRFYCHVQDKVAGPFDLVELAGELRCKNIEAETLVCREGEEEWRAFRELPEFVSAQEMPIEEIARRLEEKERASQPQSAPAKAWSVPWPSLAVGLFVVCSMGVGIVYWPGQQPPVPPAAVKRSIHEFWPLSTGVHFTVECPVRLVLRGNQTEWNTSYDGVLPGVAFGVSYIDTHGSTWTNSRDEALDLLGNGLVGELHGEEVSEHNFGNNGYSGREISFSVSTAFGPAAGRLRIIPTGGNFVIIYALLKPGSFSEDDTMRFLNSLEIH